MFLYTGDEISEKEIGKQALYTIALKRIKYLWVNLTREAKDIYAKNCKTLMKEIK